MSRSSIGVLARGGDVADQRQRDLAVGPDLQRLRELRVLVDLDAQLVAGDEAVIRWRRARPARTGAGCGAGVRAAGGCAAGAGAAGFCADAVPSRNTKESAVSVAVFMCTISSLLLRVGRIAARFSRRGQSGSGRGATRFSVSASAPWVGQHAAPISIVERRGELVVLEPRHARAR